MSEPPVATAGFDLHTHLEAAHGGPWRARINPELTGFGGTHGGYLAAIALRAATRLVDDVERTPRSLVTQLLTKVEPGDVYLQPRLERTGSSLTAASVRIEQGGATAVSALASFGRSRTSLEHAGLAMPDVPPPGECRPIVEKPVPGAKAGLLVEHRPAALPMPLTGGDRAELRVWMRLVEERPLDAPLACMLADAAPPALFGRLERFVAMPSIEIGIHFADLDAEQAGPWVLGVFRTGHAAHGYASEDGELWTPDGRLVLRARQLRRVLDAS